jgi:hypothetical protein
VLINEHLFFCPSSRRRVGYSLFTRRISFGVFGKCFLERLDSLCCIYILLSLLTVRVRYKSYFTQSSHVRVLSGSDTKTGRIYVSASDTKSSKLTCTRPITITEVQFKKYDPSTTHGHISSIILWLLIFTKKKKVALIFFLLECAFTRSKRGSTVPLKSDY